MTAVGVLLMAMAYFALASFAPWVGSAAAVLTGFAWITLLVRLPREAMFWERGAKGEQRTAAHLEPLIDRGFVVLHDRRIPGGRANIDHLAVGPTGVFVIETKNLTGKVEVLYDRLWVADRERQAYIDEVYREALAVHLALSDELNRWRLTVIPVLCIHGSRTPLFDHRVAGVRLLSGRQLRGLAEGEGVLGPDDVQELALAAERRLRHADE